jgi:GNAT superfamily N-acetyltransferase
MSDMPDDEVAETVGWLADYFRWRLRFADFDWYITARLRGVLIGNVGVLRRVVSVGEANVPVAIVGGVLTAPNYRNRGLAVALLTHADDVILREARAKHALLMCGDALLTMYGRHGWRRLDEAMWFDQPEGRRRATGNVMVKCLGDTSWPPGEIDLLGLPA